MRERRAQFRIPVLAAVDLGEPVAAVLDGIVGAEQPHTDRGRLRPVAAADKHMAQRQVPQHLREQVIQVVAAGDVFQEGSIEFLRGGEIQAMGVRIVQKIALDPPDLVVHLLPLGAWVYPYFHVGEFQRRIVGLQGFGGRDPPVPALAEQHFLAVGRDLKAGRIVRQFFRLALLEIELLNGGRIVVQRLALQQNHFALLAGRQTYVIAVGNRQRQDPLADAVEIDIEGRRFLGFIAFLFRLILRRCVWLWDIRLLGFLRLLFVTLRRQRGRVVFRKHNQVNIPRNRTVDARHVQPARREPHVGAGRQVKVLSAFVPTAEAGIAESVGNLSRLGCRQFVKIQCVQMALELFGISQPLAVG